MAQREPVTEFGRHAWTALHAQLWADQAKNRIEAMSLLANFTVDELDLVGEMIRRLESHRGEYGGLDVATDARDFREEAFREGVDLMDYLLMDWLQRERGRGQRPALRLVGEDIEIPEVGE